MKNISIFVFATTLYIALAGEIFAGSFNITSGTTTSAQTLSSGQTGLVGSAGTLSVSGSNNSITVTGNATITNNGIINQTGSARVIRDNTGGLTLSVMNNAGASMQAADSDVIQMNKSNSNITVDNYGSMVSVNASVGGSQAIDFNAITTGTNILNNYSSGLLKATAADAVRPGVNGTINNAGTIQAIPISDVTKPGDATSSDGIDAQSNSGVQITNSGSISGRHGITGGESASNFTISVTNNAGGTITAVNGAGINIDGNLSSASVVSHVTVINNGSIIGNFDSAHYTTGDGDGVDIDGIATITNNGIIRGVGASGNGSDSLANNSEGVSIGGGTIINNAGAEICGQNPTASGAEGHGILVDNSSAGDAFSATTVTNAGLIRGYTGYAIKMIGTFNDTVTNTAGGTIRGAGPGAAIQTGGGSDTLTNRGAVIGDNGQAIDLGDGDDIMIIEGGSASITGSISGGAGTNALTINPGAGNTFTISNSVSNFNTMEIKSGTTVLDGANRITSATALTLNGGTLQTSNIATANGQEFSSFSLMANSILDISGTTSLTFNDFGTFTTDATLSILNYDAALSPDYAIRFLGNFTSDISFLAFIQGTNVDGLVASIYYDGTYTDVIHVVAAPEPGTLVYLILPLAGLFVYYRHRAPRQQCNKLVTR
ncbi:MAG: PEP-CTERM sorting domain-containing protein [Chthoniobacterales bacterium]